MQQLPRCPIYCTDYSTLLYSIDYDITSFAAPQSATHRYFLEYLGLHSRISSRQILLFTDGSKSREGTGAAFCNATDEGYGQFKLTTQWSIFSAEVLVIRQALMFVTQVEQSQILFFFSDCQGAIRAITSTFFSVHVCWLVINCKLIIKRLQEVQHNSVSLIWTPGHQGIVGNEKADALAKQAIHLTQNTTLSIPLRTQ